MRLDLLRHRLRKLLHRAILCRLGWHVGGNMPWSDEGREYCRCMWCDREFQMIGGEWRHYIRPPRQVYQGRIIRDLAPVSGANPTAVAAQQGHAKDSARG